MYYYIIVGGLILWRVAPEGGERMSRWRWLVFVFSAMVLASGMCCFLVEKVSHMYVYEYMYICTCILYYESARQKKRKSCVGIFSHGACLEHVQSPC